MKSKYTRGSLWRKWDLHIHPPGTKLNDQYNEDWDRYIDLLSKSDVAVFGITDYFSVDGYKNLLQHINLSKNEKIKKKVFFPNVELRLDVSPNKNDENGNIHIIFDPERCSIEDIEKFLSKLEITRTKASGAKCYCNPEDLSSIGYAAASVTIEHLDMALKAIWGTDKRCRPYLIIGAYNGYGGIRADSKSSRKCIISDEVEKVCDMVFGRNSDTEYFLLGNRYEDKSVKALPKPVITGCDAHSIEDLEKSLGKMYMQQDGNISKECMWIKADPTFEGLRQLKYEPLPGARVYIGMDKPNQNLTPDLMIDQVRFIDNSQANIFQPKPIKFNPYLTTVIGGKSSGKSLLAYYTVKTIDAQIIEQVISKSDRKYDFEYEKGKENYDKFDFEVVWNDGKKYLLSDDIRKKTRAITFIPQLYIYELSKESNEDKLNQEIIMKFLSSREKFSTFYEGKMKLITDSQNALETKIIDLSTAEDTLSDLNLKIKNYGDINSKINNAENLKKQINELSELSKLTNLEKKEFRTLSKTREKAEKLLEESLENLEDINDFESQFMDDFYSIKSSIQDRFDEENSHNVPNITKLALYKSILDALQLTINKISDKQLKSTKQKFSLAITKYEKQIEHADQSLSMFSPVLANQNTVKELMEKRKTILSEIVDYYKIQKKLNTQILYIEKVKKDIIAKYKETASYYAQIAAFLQDDNFRVISSIEKDENLELQTEVGFNCIKFDEKVTELIDKVNTNLRVLHSDCFQDNKFVYDNLNHLEYVERVFNDIFSGKLKLRTGIKRKDFLSKLLDNYFVLKFQLKQGNDDFFRMSPGKQGLVLLKLILHLSNSTNPIIIDQPEDNLDNRTIYNRLSSFIREKKLDRQIIIITHNANLVVTTDAEEIIVANHDGNDKGNNENKKYRFEYKSGALENSFENMKAGSVLEKMGIREHVCEILEGGKIAFSAREKKYNINNT